MSENLRRFTRAVYGFDAVVHRVAEDAWDRPSPCAGWSARDVVGHQVAVLDGVTRAARGEDIGMPVSPDSVEDPVALWDDCRDALLAALDTMGSLQRSGPYWFGEMTVDQLIGVVQWDPLTHAWDLARATGETHVPDQELAESSLATIGPNAEQFRKMKLIVDPVPVNADADPWTRYLGLVGRDPTS